MASSESCCSNWKFCKYVGLSIGWLGVLANCGLIYGLCQQKAVGYTAHETIIAFLPGLNFVSSCCWIYGVSQSKPRFMLAALIWFGTNVCLLTICILSYFSHHHGDIHRPTKSLTYFSVAIVYWICSFFVAVICYMSAKKATYKQPVDV